jgi:polyisoprenoid-binding protein YceI
MKIQAFLPTLLITGWLSAPALAVDTYNIDPAHSRVGFSVTHMVINTVKGDFRQFSGTVELQDGKLSEAKGTIQAASVNTGNDKRDTHLKSPDFFDAANFPTISFQSKRVEKKGDETVLVGDFTMHGVTKELALPVTVKGPIQGMGTRIGLQIKAKLNRKDYGIKFNAAMGTGEMVVSDEVELEINAEAVKGGGPRQ